MTPPGRGPRSGDEVYLYGSRWAVVEVGEGGNRVMLRHVANVDVSNQWLDLAAWRDLEDAVEAGDARGDDES